MITLRLPKELADLMGASESIQRLPDAPTLGELLRALDDQMPGVFARICGPDGRIRRHLNIFVGDKNARLNDGLGTRLASDADVWVLQAISGG